MPEGDTVWNTASLLASHLTGATIERSDFRVPALATVDLRGWQIAESAAWGKHLLLRCTPPAGPPTTLHSHLRMDGSWRVFPPGQPWRGRPSHLIRVVLHTATAVAVGYHLHEVALVRTDHEDDLVGHLGPDLLRDEGTPGGWDRAEAVRRLRRSPQRTVAEALLDQTCLAGIGNLYKSEVLFLRGINPWTPISAIGDLEPVVELARRLLRANLGRWAQATTGSLRRGEQTYVYGRSGAPCRRCATTIANDIQGERRTYWCPRCQPAVSPAPRGLPSATTMPG